MEGVGLAAGVVGCCACGCGSAGWMGGDACLTGCASLDCCEIPEEKGE